MEEASGARDTEGAIESTGGMDVESARRPRLRAIAQRLSELATEFACNVHSATRDWSKHILDDGALAGLPVHAQQRARARAQAEDREGFVLTLDPESYEAAVQHIDDRRLRQEVYEAYVTRASDHGPRKGRFDNTALIDETLALRHELSQLLGFTNYAELALRRSVLPSTEAVERYLLRGGSEVRARAQRELDAVWAFAKSKGAPRGFSTWDLAYYGRWWQREQNDLDEDELRPYFFLPAALSFAFAMAEKVLGLRVVPLLGQATALPARRSYRVIADENNELGLLELETYRVGSMPAGMSVTFRDDPEQLPVARVCLGLEPDDAADPPQLAHAQLVALFGCLGQTLLSMLVGQGQPGADGRRRDSATLSKLAGALLAQFCWHFETLSTFARHHETGISLPRALFDKLVHRRELLAGLEQSRALELALFDLRLHRDYVPAGRATQLRAHVVDTLAQVRREVCVLRPPFWERMPSTCLGMFADTRAVRQWEDRWAKHMARDLFGVLEAHRMSIHATRRLRTVLWLAGEGSLVERLTHALGRAPDLRA